MQDSPWCDHGFLQLLTRPWMMQIICVLRSGGPTRFGALRRKIAGISPRVLCERLRLLEEQKLVFRHAEKTVPPAVTYGLTNRVEEIEKVLEGLSRLARAWQAQEAGASSKDSSDAPPRASRVCPPLSGASPRCAESKQAAVLPLTSVASHS